LMFLNIQIHLIILKTHDQQVTLTTKKSLHIIFKATRNQNFNFFKIQDSGWPPFWKIKKSVFGTNFCTLTIWFLRIQDGRPPPFWTSSAVAEMGDRLATIDLGRKFGSWVQGLISVGMHGNSVPLLLWQRELSERSSHWNKWPIGNAEFPIDPQNFRSLIKIYVTNARQHTI